MRQIIRTPEFDEYYIALPERIKEKFDYVLEILITQHVVSEKFVKSIVGTEFYEVRISVGYNEYRTLLIAIDNISFISCKQAILLNSFLKKDKKQYRREILKAKEILKRYKL